MALGGRRRPEPGHCETANPPCRPEVTERQDATTGRITTTAADLKTKAAASTSFNDLFAINVIGDANKVVVPTGSTLLSTASAGSKPKEPVVIVPKSPDTALEGIRYDFQTVTTAADEAVVYDNVAPATANLLSVAPFGGLYDVSTPSGEQTNLLLEPNPPDVSPMDAAYREWRLTVPAFESTKICVRRCL